MTKSNKLILASVLGLLVFSGAAIAFVVGVIAMSPDFTTLRSQVKVPIKLANKSKSTRWVGPKAPGWVPLRSVSNHVLMAVIASEDASFFSHDGIDMHEIREAIKKDLEEKRWARGASTITQQVVKNVWLSQEKTLTRKVREILWARQLDKVLSKHEILAFYVNMVEWGPGLYGIGNAARYYFGKSPAELTPRESAFLAILLPSPWRYHSYFVRKELTPWAEKRVAHVLRVMNRMGFLDDDQYQAALREPLWGKAPTILQGDEDPGAEPPPSENIGGAGAGDESAPTGGSIPGGSDTAPAPLETPASGDDRPSSERSVPGGPVPASESEPRPEGAAGSEPQLEPQAEPGS